MITPTILAEDNHLLVINKPCGWATMGALPGEPSIVDWARDDLKRRYHKPGNVYLGVVSRLDTFVSGVLVLAKTSKAAARLSAQFAAQTTTKTYWAIVPGQPEPSTGEWQDYLVKDDRAHRVIRVSANHTGAQLARLRYTVKHSHQDYSWLQIELLTGRKHQIRVQCATRGFPIYGDRKYGSRENWAPHSICLHARELSLDHPTRTERLTWTAPLPANWQHWQAWGIPG